MRVLKLPLSLVFDPGSLYILTGYSQASSVCSSSSLLNPPNRLHCTQPGQSSYKDLKKKRKKGQED